MFKYQHAILFKQGGIKHQSRYGLKRFQCIGGISKNDIVFFVARPDIPESISSDSIHSFDAKFSGHFLNSLQGMNILVNNVD